MVNGEVAPVRVSAKQVELLFVYNEFLKRENFHESKIFRVTGWNLLLTVRIVSVPLSHNLTVLLATEKLKSQDWHYSCTVWSSAAMNQPSVQQHRSRADMLVSGALLPIRVWNCRLSKKKKMLWERLYFRGSRYLYQFVSLHYVKMESWWWFPRPARKHHLELLHVLTIKVGSPILKWFINTYVVAV